MFYLRNFIGNVYNMCLDAYETYEAWEMNQHLKNLLRCVFGWTSALYLSIAFITLHMNQLKWSECARTGFVVSDILAILIFWMIIEMAQDI